MNSLRESLWAETLKMRRSKVPLFASLGFFILPFVGGLFMMILKDPEAAKSMGLITAKAQITAGTADWPGYFDFLKQGVAMGGMILFSIMTTWIFGREFSDHTVKEILALPTTRETIITAKFISIIAWSLVITLLVFGTSLVIGALVVLPGWSLNLLRISFIDIVGGTLLTLPLISYVALLASNGRGYLPPFGWMILTLVLANIAAIMGWGDWFPWAIPALFSGIAGPRTEWLGVHSYIILILASLIGFALTYWWWRTADQTR